MIADREKKLAHKEPEIESVIEEFDDLVGGEDEDVIPLEKNTLSVPEKSSEVLPNGWKVISEEQQNGMAYLVTHVLDGEGVLAFWRRTRMLSHNRWVLHGRWSDSLTRADIIPQPLYYKDVT